MHSSAPTYPTPSTPTAAPYNIFKRVGMLLLALLIVSLGIMVIVLQSFPNMPTNQQNINSLGLAGSRVLSGGLIVPVLLHASTEVIALILNYIQIPG
ncbi:hypothetical protein [Pseudomonas wadenswilerensis]|uniref:Transmembrane protein n=1 Tax=Pseudomonas wadenswilerensis TaxID=1785161 RepID=A0A380SY09_9PSED|nr:hypothetical protein [Pseudomonas wadenswilerensis]SUQ62867.1 hypothetical protein CCOS864_02316 [Pseudomonas wadenswilerensis]